MRKINEKKATQKQSKPKDEKKTQTTTRQNSSTSIKKLQKYWNWRQFTVAWLGRE